MSSKKNPELNPEPRTPNCEPRILSIETSCDETAVAITCGNKILSNVVLSQIKDHQPYGGVVPELASRKHIVAINYLLDRALDDADIGFKDIDAVAVSTGPGLVGALMVGVSAAKALSLALKIPLLSINHIEAHMYSVLPANRWLKAPFICLVVSGGHTMLVHVKDFGRYKLLGGTLDDAAGEAFDKVGKFVGLPYPGGPQIEKKAKTGDENKYAFPRPMLKSGDYNFSFSGLKTALIYFVRDLEIEKVEYKIDDIAASFQKAVCDVLIEKTFSAAEEFQTMSIAVVGGVSSNSYLRNRFADRAAQSGYKIALPEANLSTDNAAMVGLAANKHYEKNEFSDLRQSVDPNWRLPLLS